MLILYLFPNTRDIVRNVLLWDKKRALNPEGGLRVLIHEETAFSAFYLRLLFTFT